jgi:hypothetical protein
LYVQLRRGGAYEKGYVHVSIVGVLCKTTVHTIWKSKIVPIDEVSAWNEKMRIEKLRKSASFTMVS